MLTRVQKLINIKIAKAYRTVSNEALCIITGLNPFILKEKTAEVYNIGRGNSYRKLQIDHDKPLNNGFTQQTRQIPLSRTIHKKTQHT